MLAFFTHQAKGLGVRTRNSRARFHFLGRDQDQHIYFSHDLIVEVFKIRPDEVFALGEAERGELRRDDSNADHGGIPAIDVDLCAGMVDFESFEASRIATTTRSVFLADLAVFRGMSEFPFDPMKNRLDRVEK